MGMERVVTFSGAGPSWAAVRHRLSAAGVAVQMRMIDNLPAFPNEEPPDDWRELRVTLGAGMITIRREPGRVRLTVWGNADEEFRRHQELLARSFEDADGGNSRPTSEA
ncbi:MAG TPA: hypothetical protein VKE40_00170 [Gemmataceae bacterium]|nr:hypothetical protein [Gemmataceae bacterium]